MSASVKVEMIPIVDITVVNPRIRNTKIHDSITNNIDLVGLKRPITVRRLSDEGKYALVCGQGRLESLKMLGQESIPAIIVDVDKETGHIMSLVENIARRSPRANESLQQVSSLREKGYSEAEIGNKIGYSESWVKNVLHLLKKGESKLLSAAEAGHISLNLAYQISRVDDADAQILLYEAYEKGDLSGHKVSVIRKIMEQRNNNGRGHGTYKFGLSNPTKKLSPDELASLYQEHTEKHRSIQKKAQYAKQTIILAQQIFKELHSNQEFTELLEAENLGTVPKPLVNYSSDEGVF